MIAAIRVLQQDREKERVKQQQREMEDVVQKGKEEEEQEKKTQQVNAMVTVMIDSPLISHDSDQSFSIHVCKTGKWKDYYFW